MAGKKRINITLKWMASVLSLAAGAYAGYVGVTWLRRAPGSRPLQGSRSAARSIHARL